ncbi:hypothetical protein [Natronococcus roseus]|uniref:hypothetical protein n=1 Tax=Natronococcus roseus TaxID=1052014 RepID=UPI00374D624C
MTGAALPSPIDRLAERYRTDGARAVCRLTGRHLADRYRDERARLRWKWAKQVAREPIAEPSLIRIDPNDVDHVLAHYPSGVDGHYPLGVFGGPWDRDRTRIDALAVYRALHVHFGQDVPWVETDGYRRARRRIENGGTGWKGAETVAELDERCAETDRLYESIRDEGYRSQADLDAAVRAGETVPSHGTSTQDPRVPDELKLAIGRNGVPIRAAGGKHRLAIARLLDCEAIPAAVIVRHSRWEAIRAEVATANSLEGLSDRARIHLDHPDLRELVPGSWVNGR